MAHHVIMGHGGPWQPTRARRAVATNLQDIGGAEELLARGRALAGDLRAQHDLIAACANLGYLLRALMPLCPCARGDLRRDRPHAAHL